MNITVRQAGSVTVLDLTGEVDLYHSPRCTANGRVMTQRQKQIVLNFQGVTYIDSSGLATLIGAFQQLRPHGGSYGSPV
jgi:anti-sigma B factor antagonist